MSGIRYVIYFKPEIVEGRVIRCEGSLGYYDTPSAAEDGAKKEKGPYVIGDEGGTVYTAPESLTTARRHR